MKDREPRFDQSQSPRERGKGLRGLSTPQTEHPHPREKAPKPSRIPDQIVMFIQHAYAAGADKSLKERQRMFIAHAVTKPQLTFRELAPFGGVYKMNAARQLWNRGLQALWQASPAELQQQYPLNLLLGHRRNGRPGIPLSAEHKQHISEAKKGKPHSVSAETRRRISEGKKGKPRKPFTPEHKARISVAMRKSRERRKQQKQQEADLTQREQEQHETSQIFPSSQKT